MSNISLIIEERASHIGSFLVGRLLPFRQKRAVGPFVFIDHMGPASMDSTENLDVPPHPHIGLSTLTYLFEGAIMHRDSLGTEMEILPGAVNWMTAGKGIVHSERTPQRLRKTDKKLHGLQIWIALPRELEKIQPSFTHIASEQLPIWKIGDMVVKLIAGEVMGKISPVPVHSPLYLLELKSSGYYQVDIGDQLYGESGIYILQGGINVDGEEYAPKQLLVAKDSSLCRFEMHPETIIYIFGGEPFPEERHIYWNFVSSDKETIEKAKKEWKNQTFDRVLGETEFVPLP